ncbi:AraC family transcriptional regulator [Tenacibaculum sp. 190130A14a]|uniref:AraC family transcriptional regulator n=1 Tax=Tenacibaculum polynesiense TaxID=3137857 RepID=A0ABP1EXP8_9FLAO
MLKTIQIVALIQGLFLLTVLFIKKDMYKRLNFWLLFVTILSLLLHIVGDDDFNLFQTDANWYVFHSPLVVTLFFLLIKYHNTDETNFKRKDFLYFLPYMVFVLLQAMENLPNVNETFPFLIAEGIIGVIMMYFLGSIIQDILKKKKDQWMLIFIVPYSIAYVIDSFSYFFTGEHDAIPFLESYGVIGISALLLYVILFKLVVTPKEILPKGELKEYKTSSLKKANIEAYKIDFLRLMEEEKLFKDPSLTVNQVAKRMNIPRQHLSEVLNVHMKTGFQDFINKKRLEEFVKYLKDDTFNNYTILGIATEVGFKSKSSFNTAFKKHYGMTPTEFKKNMINQ